MKFGAEKDEVLIRKNGMPTYFAADIAYHRNKFETRGFDKCIDIWGADHHGHVAVSYTHLDVYKRQEHNSPASYSAGSAWLSSNSTGVSRPNMETMTRTRFFSTSISSTAVSYTHLQYDGSDQAASP